jgi:hypothetical protein
MQRRVAEGAQSRQQHAGHSGGSKSSGRAQRCCCTCAPRQSGSSLVPLARPFAPGRSQQALQTSPTPTIAAAASDQPDASSGAAAPDPVEERQLFVKLSIANSTGRLDLSDMRLARLPGGLWEISDLEELSLAGNDLRSLPEHLEALPALRRLVLAGNRLEALPAALGGLTDLEGVWAHGNYLTGLPDGVGKLTGLKHLSLAGAFLGGFDMVWSNGGKGGMREAAGRNALLTSTVSNAAANVRHTNQSCFLQTDPPQATSSSRCRSP